MSLKYTKLKKDVWKDFLYRRKFIVRINTMIQSKVNFSLIIHSGKYKTQKTNKNTLITSSRDKMVIFVNKVSLKILPKLLK